MTRSIEDILAGAKRPEAEVPLCMRADLVREFERLEAQLSTAPREAASLGDVSPARRIAQQIEDLRAAMADAEVVFQLRAMPSRDVSNLALRRPEAPDKPEPGPKGEVEPAARDAYDTALRKFADDWHMWLCEMVAATVYEPAMTVAQADDLSQVLSDPQWTLLADSAYVLNTSRQLSVPTSAAASAILATDEPRSRRRSSSASPGRNSSALSE